MSIVNLQDIHVGFGSDVIFDGLELVLHPKEKAGLIGPNGSGKTTLLKLILGTIRPDIGKVAKNKSLAISYLPQEPQIDPDQTVEQFLHSAAGPLFDIEKKIKLISARMEQLEGEELAKAMKQYDRLCHEFHTAGGYAFNARAREIAAGLGFEQRDFAQKVAALSGGQISRLYLARVLLEDSQLLLLDEPTNHLDWEGTEWLQRFLNNYPGAAVIVSHDRYLLDRVIEKVVEVHHTKVRIFTGNYSTYRQQKEIQDLQLQRQHDQRTAYIERTKDFIARNKDQEGMSKVARGRKKFLNRLLDENPDFLDKPTHDKTLDFAFAGAERKSVRTQTVLEFSRAGIAFDGLELFKDLTFDVQEGQRLGIIGPNGTGKTTLLKLALGKLEPTAGSVKRKTNISVGYLDQAGAELDGDLTVLDSARQVRPKMTPEQIRGRLGAFLFSGDDVLKKVESLSGGEHNRLALCRLVLSAPQVLILDEPTNHLDIPSREMLEEALSNFDGTVITVSHDRYFLEEVADRLLVIGANDLGHTQIGEFELFLGPYSAYADALEKRNAAAAEEKTKKPMLRKTAAVPKSKTPAELKQFNPWSIEQIEDEIVTVEQQIEQMQEQFGDEDIYKDPDRYQRLQDEFESKKAYLDLLWRAYEHRNR